MLSILEVNEEDEPDSESDFEFEEDDDCSTEIKLTPLKLYKDHNLDALCIKIRSSLYHF